MGWMESHLMNLVEANPTRQTLHLPAGMTVTQMHEAYGKTVGANKASLSYFYACWEPYKKQISVSKNVTYNLIIIIS